MTDSKTMAAIAYQALDEKKGEDIKVLDISEVSILADYFIIASGGSTPQLQALVDNVLEKLNKAGCHVKRVEGSRGSGWNLLDYGDLVVHIFEREDRQFFDLERIWSDGKVIAPETLSNL
jgi:ribosome-associated protein